jgi:hypothetical protein
MRLIEDSPWLAAAVLICRQVVALLRQITEAATTCAAWMTPPRIVLHHQVMRIDSIDDGGLCDDISEIDHVAADTELRPWPRCRRRCAAGCCVGLCGSGTPTEHGRPA